MTARHRTLATFALLAAISCAPAAAQESSSGGGAEGAGDGTSQPAPGANADPGASPAPSASSTATPGPTTSAPANNGFPAHWIDGTACKTDPLIQTWKFTDDTFILRQSLCSNFEGPFMYLLVGANKAILVDTGTGGVDLRGAVMGLLGGKNVQLVVAHSHSHGDHTSGDGGFKNQPSTTLVGTQPSQVKQFFGITGDGPATYDLGGRAIDVLAIPGHEAAHVAYYDHETGILLSGDTLYPGRLYIDDWSAYRTSVPRLAAFIDATRPVSYVLGGHIELPMTGADYAYGATVHPNEHALQLADADLRELSAAVTAMGNNPVRQVHPDFIVSP